MADLSELGFDLVSVNGAPSFFSGYTGFAVGSVSGHSQSRHFLGCGISTRPVSSTSQVDNGPPDFRDKSYISVEQAPQPELSRGLSCNRNEASYAQGMGHQTDGPPNGPAEAQSWGPNHAGQYGSRTRAGSCVSQRPSSVTSNVSYLSDDYHSNASEDMGPGVRCPAAIRPLVQPGRENMTMNDQTRKWEEDITTTNDWLRKWEEKIDSQERRENALSSVLAPGPHSGSIASGNSSLSDPNDVHDRPPSAVNDFGSLLYAAFPKTASPGSVLGVGFYPPRLPNTSAGPWISTAPPPVPPKIPLSQSSAVYGNQGYPRYI